MKGCVSEIFWCIVLVLLSIYLILDMYSSDSELEKHINYLKSCVNSEVIINNDTVKVVNYNLMKGELVLENDKIISVEYYKANKL